MDESPEIDNVDRRILAALGEDSRASLTALAAQLGLARATVRARMERLQRIGAIRRFTIETDLAQRDQVRAVMCVALQGSVARQVVRALKGIAGVEALYMTNGAWDLVAMISVDNLAEFDRVLGQIRAVQGVLNSESSLLLNRA